MQTSQPTFVIISCGARKLGIESPACELYTGPLFVKQLKYARSIAPDHHIRILSAKHGLVRLDERLQPYNERLQGRTCSRAWGKLIRRQWRRTFLGIRELPLTLLAGDIYARHLSDALMPYLREAPQFIRPLLHMGLGYQIQWLTQQLHPTEVPPLLEVACPERVYGQVVYA